MVTAAPGHLYTAPGFLTKLAIFLYDGLLLFGVLFVAGLGFEALTRYRGEVPLRVWFQIYCFGIVAAYFIWFWARQGQTLAMRAWRIRLTNVDGSRLRWPQAALRFVLAVLAWGLLGATLWWSLFDRDKQYLHDRLAGTRLARE